MCATRLAGHSRAGAGMQQGTVRQGVCCLRVEVPCLLGMCVVQSWQVEMLCCMSLRIAQKVLIL